MTCPAYRKRNPHLGTSVSVRNAAPSAPSPAKTWMPRRAWQIGDLLQSSTKTAFAVSQSTILQFPHLLLRAVPVEIYCIVDWLLRAPSLKSPWCLREDGATCACAFYGQCFFSTVKLLVVVMVIKRNGT